MKIHKYFENFEANVGEKGGGGFLVFSNFR